MEDNVLIVHSETQQALTTGNIHPSVFYTCLIHLGSQGDWSLFRLSLGERQGTPWRGRQAITGTHREK